MTALAYQATTGFVTFGTINAGSSPFMLHPSTIGGVRLGRGEPVRPWSPCRHESGQPAADRVVTDRAGEPPQSAGTAPANKGAADDVSVLAARPAF
jgi:hypothetical protein